MAAPQATLPVNRWIISETVETLAALDKALGDLRFDAAANTIYHFVWDRFCDWYLELIKPVLSEGQKPSPLQGRELGEGESPPHAEADNSNDGFLSPEGERGIDETRIVAGWVLDQILVMLHPFMPFITEELWHSMGTRPYDLIVAKWPEPQAQVDAEAKAEIDWLVKLVSEVRAAKAELNIAPGAKMAAHVRDGDAELMQRIDRQTAALDRVGRLENVTASDAPAGAAAQIVVDGATYVLPLEGVIDIAAEKARLTKARDAVLKEAQSLEGRLNNANFIERAKPEAVEKARADHAGKTAEAERLQAALARLG